MGPLPYVVTLPHALNFVKLVLTGVLNSAKDKLTGNQFLVTCM